MDRYSHIAHETITFGISAFCAMIAAAAALIPNAIVETSVGLMPIVIMDDEKMRIVCIIGAIAGGVITTFLSSERDVSFKAIISRALLSTLCGVIFTPMVFQWREWAPNTDRLLAGSAIVAMLAVGVLKSILPLWQTFAAKFLSPPSQ